MSPSIRIAAAIAIAAALAAATTACHAPVNAAAVGEPPAVPSDVQGFVGTEPRAPFEATSITPAETAGASVD